MQPTVVANLDAHGFCRGYNNPLAMMGVALDRYLPGRNAMLANEVYVVGFTKVYLLANYSNNTQLPGRIFSLYTLAGMAFYQN